MQEKKKDQQKAVLNRIARTTGHLRAVQTMVETGRDCSEVLIQLAAVKAEIMGVSRELMKDCIKTAVEEAVEEDTGDLKSLSHLFDLFM